MDHNDMYKGLATVGYDFVIFSVDSIVAQPSKGSLDDPPAFE